MEEREYWQIAAGDGSIDLPKIFTELNVALLGPGQFGDFFDNKKTYKEYSDGHLIQKFAEEIQIGDVLVMKHIKDSHKKTWEIQAVGVVEGPYRYESIFSSITPNKWNVQHCRRVSWKVPKEPLIVQRGGAPIRLQRLNEGNPLREKAIEILNGKIECK
ncbi:hypothetical protein [Bacillus paranthracis]|uniref:hypothetical protein n=1 Tax=Bacillus paranthracis TaxID=2026186 RepID=UPI0018CDDA59|nr:hypothetical protein [Bacillus paranthracis]MBG9908378.1 hypothetical protein [Bacillus paranthracis]